MVIREDDRRVIEAYYGAMRAGAVGGDAMMRLFAEDAVYVEPFSGTPRTHVGAAAIRRNFLESQINAPPDMTLAPDRVEIAGDQIRSAWTCDSPAFRRPVRGQELWTIRDGTIVRLETSLVDQA